jgi:hypothetical protein
MHLQRNAVCIRIHRCWRVSLRSTGTKGRQCYQDFFNRQEHSFSKLGKYYEWTKEQAEQNREKANTIAELDYTPEIVHHS